MLIEQRFTWVDQIIARRAYGADIISVGSESCIAPFFHINNHWDDFLEVVDLDIRVKIITPRITQSELFGTINLLKKMINLHRQIDIVINDWGILQFCIKQRDNLNIHLGRQLCRSLLDCPWHQEVLDKEEMNVRKIIGSHPYSNLKRIESLQRQGVRGLELNALYRSFDFKSVLDLNLELAVHGESYLLTCGRTCLAQRIVPNKTCQDICEKKFHLKPFGKWMNYFENQEPFSDYEKSMLNGLELSGKKVILPQKADIADIASSLVNVLIADHDTINKYIKGEK